MAIKSLKSGSYGRSVMAGNSLILPGDFESIATTTVGSGNAASVTFSSIPQTFTHLQLRILMRGSSGSQNAGFVRFNSDSANNYVNHQLFGNGSTITSNGGSSVSGCYIQKIPGSSDAASCFGVAVMDILDYKNTNKYTTTRYLGGDDLNGAGFAFLGSGLWLNTAAITSINIVTDGGGDFVQYSHFALYGIRG